MIEYKRVKAINEKATTAASNMFRAAIIYLKLGAAAKHFSTHSELAVQLLLANWI